MKKNFLTIPIRIQIDYETNSELEKLTKNGLINKSEFVRRALKDYMKRQKKEVAV